MSPKPSDQLLRSVTERVVDSFTSQGALFTGLDISNAVKTTLPEVRHRDVSPLVRELFDSGAMGDYDHTLIDVVAQGNTKAQAYLYHLPEHDASLYNDAMRAQLAIPPVSTSLTLSDSPMIVPSTTETPVEVGRDGRGRVSRQLLANALITADSVRITAQRSPDRVVITNATGTEPEDIMAATVACEHPSLIQIPRGLMGVFPPGAKLVARIEGNSVVIEVPLVQ
jgi:hypothetical protein